MVIKTRSTKIRVMAMLMAIFIFVGVVPINSLAETPEKVTITFTVTDNEGQPVNGALISYSITAKDAESFGAQGAVSATANTNVATVEITDPTVLALFENGATVTATSIGNYFTGSATVEFASGEDSKDIAISLTEEETATFTFNVSEGGSVLQGITFKYKVSLDSGSTWSEETETPVSDSTGKIALDISKKALDDGTVKIQYSREENEYYAAVTSKEIAVSSSKLSEDVALTAKYYTVSMDTVPSNGKVAINGSEVKYTTKSFTVKAGSDVLIAVDPNNNYNVAAFTVGDVNVGTDKDSYTISAINADTKVVVQFSQYDPATMSYSVDYDDADVVTEYAGDKVNGTAPVYVMASNTASITITPTGYLGIRSSGGWSNSWKPNLQSSVNNKVQEIYYKENKSNGFPKAFETLVPVVVVDNDAPTISSNTPGVLYGNSTDGVALSLTASDLSENGDYTYSGFNSDCVKAYYTKDGVYDSEEPDKLEEFSIDLTVKSNGDVESKEGETISFEDISFNDTGIYDLYATVTDRAGRESQSIWHIIIDDTRPKVEVAFEPTFDPIGSSLYLYNNATGIDKVTATIKITDKYFDSDKATKAVKLSAMVKGATLDSAELPTLSSWSDEGDTHTATLTISKQAIYKLNIEEYFNLCGIGADGYSQDFIFDTEAPTGQLKISDKNIEKPEGETIFEKIFNTIGNFFKDIFGISEDETLVAEVLTGESNLSDNVSSSGAIEISYYVANDLSKDYMLSTGNTAPENTVFIDEETWTSEKPELDADGKYIVFARIKDEAGNITYLDSEGIVVDTTPPAPDGEVTAPVITVKPDQEKDYYNGNVNLDVSVIDPIVNDVYSGISSISYEIYNMGEQTESNETYFKYDGDLSKDSVIQAYNENINGYKQIEVNAADNNSNDVAIVVTAIDNAGNVSEAFEKIVAIDTKAPAINVSYDNNSATNGKYYNETRVATVTVTERNFDPDNTVITIKNSDGVMPTISDWKMIKDGTGNKDDREYSATITYFADGDYTFDIKAKDLAGNEATEITYEGSNPTEFTIDKTLPVVSVAYNNNNASNQKYFNATRTATVTVKEHNFDVDRVEFTQTAKLNGSSIGIPTATWTHNGDTHTATIKYTADGDYTFDVAMTDAANNKAAAANYGSSVAGKEFTIDTKIENPVITGVSNGVAYKDEVVPVITIDDVNLADVDIELIRSVKGKTENVTAQFIKNATFGDQGGSVTNDTFEKIQDNDGIYTLTVKMTDKAGNTSSESVRFTVNRFGSVYELGDYTKDLQNAYVQKVTNKLIITEYNPSPLEEGSLKIKVTRDGNPIKNLKFTTSPTINDLVAPGESGWYQYEYALDPANFAEDGVYTIIISSKDIAGNTPETTNYDDCEMTFSVDTVAPEFTSIKGLEKAIVNASKLDVEFEVFDAIGIAKVEVYVDGEKVAVFEKEKIDDVINFVSQFTIGEGTKQKVQLVAYDFAGNKADTDLFGTKDADGNVIDPGYKFNKTVTVSTNFFVRWYANKPLFWGTIALIVAGSTGIIVAAKKKKDEEENK